MKISKYINEEYLDVEPLRKIYTKNHPFPHIVIDNFFNQKLILKIKMNFLI